MFDNISNNEGSIDGDVIGHDVGLQEQTVPAEAFGQQLLLPGSTPRPAALSCLQKTQLLLPFELLLVPLLPAGVVCSRSADLRHVCC